MSKSEEVLGQTVLDSDQTPHNAFDRDFHFLSLI